MSDLFVGAGTVSWLPSVADPGNPTAAELAAAVEIGTVGRVEAASLPGPDESARTIRDVIGRDTFSASLRIVGPVNYGPLLEHLNRHDFLFYAQRHGADEDRATRLWQALSVGIREGFHASWVLWALASVAVLDHPAHGLLWCPTCATAARKVGKS